MVKAVSLDFYGTVVYEGNEIIKVITGSILLPYSTQRGIRFVCAESECVMKIIYNDEMKHLPIEQLHELFITVGWSDSGELPDEMRAGFMQPWLNSTLVISAWDGDRLVGAVRVLSDTIFRSIIYDLLVSPEYQGKGIGSELVRRCLEHFPGSGWLVCTEGKTPYFYKKLGFSEMKETDIVLGIPCRYF